MSRNVSKKLLCLISCPLLLFLSLTSCYSVQSTDQPKPPEYSLSEQEISVGIPIASVTDEDATQPSDCITTSPAAVSPPVAESQEVSLPTTPSDRPSTEDMAPKPSASSNVSETLPTPSGDATTCPVPAMSAPNIAASDIPAFDGSEYAIINNNVPFFSSLDLTTEPFEYYSDLDTLGRCGFAYANICKELMPTEPRGNIGMIKPSGWHTVRYDDIVDGKYLYNRCHLIAFQLAGENANEKNLITGTRWMNIGIMLSYESQVASYVNSTGNHVLYRSTPIFEGNNLVANGILLEAKSVEDDGKGVCFNVFVYNVQPGIIIDYATGESWIDESYTNNSENTVPDDATQVAPSIEKTTVNSEEPITPIPAEVTYILNKNTKKFHTPNCASVLDIKEKNKIASTETRDEIIAKGYTPCGSCHP